VGSPYSLFAISLFTALPFQENIMALPELHPVSEATLQAFSRSIGATPEAAYLRVPFRCKVMKVGCVTQGTITTADATVATAINGVAITGGSITVTIAGAAAGQVFTATPSGANVANEDDVVSFTPSGASGANIGGQFFAVLRRI
jgi:hypothetical protein